MKLDIVISSGKGGTGKTFISTNIAMVLDKMGKKVRYLDCDVEEPNGHLFLKPEILNREDVLLRSPAGVDEDKCIACGKCVEVCHYNALALINKKVLFFRNLCHICGGCAIVCPEDAILEDDRKIGELISGKSGRIDFHYALLETGEGGMSPRLIKKVKERTGEAINILDSSPGTACPVVETVKGADLCVLVTDPTPFGINDLKLAVNMCRELHQEPVVIVNRAEYLNHDLKDYLDTEGLRIIGEIPDVRAIAECYSVGDLASEKFPEYFTLFQTIAENILREAGEKRKPVLQSTEANRLTGVSDSAPVECNTSGKGSGGSAGKELVVISGKGGTGKTSLVASFCALEKNLAISDCDVDAADLHLLLKPERKQRGFFSGGDLASINPVQCTGCGACAEQCRFDAIKKVASGETIHYQVDNVSCEGCGVCGLVCNFSAISFTPGINGEWFISETRFGPMSHAKLGASEENSGKLVSLIRAKKNELASQRNLGVSLIDGSPGTGCPVIASLTGTDYALVVTEPTVSGIHDLKRVLEVIRFFRIKAGIIVNKYDLNPSKSAEIQDIANESGADFLGEIPYDKSVTAAQMKGISVVEHTRNGVTDQIRKIWAEIKRLCVEDKEPRASSSLS